MKKHKIKTSPSGSICAGIFDERCSKHTKDGLVIRETYRFPSHKRDIYKKVGSRHPLIIKPKSKILIVNTGGLN